MGDNDIYIETCHTFGKGFLEPMLEICHDTEIIILHRNPIDVAMSMYRLGDIPGRTKTGMHWYLGPNDRLSLTRLNGLVESEYVDYHYFKNVLTRLKFDVPENYEQYYRSIISNKINEKLYRKHHIPRPPDIYIQIDQIHHDLIIK